MSVPENKSVQSHRSTHDNDIELSDAETANYSRDSHHVNYSGTAQNSPTSRGNIAEDESNEDDDEDTILHRITGNYRRFSQNQRSRDRLDELLTLNNNRNSNPNNNSNLLDESDDENGEEEEEEANDYDHNMDDHHRFYDNDYADEAENNFGDTGDRNNDDTYNESEEDEFGDGSAFDEAFNQPNALRMLATAFGSIEGQNTRLSELEAFLSHRLNDSNSENTHGDRQNFNGTLFNSFVNQLMPSSNLRIGKLIDELDRNDSAYLILETLNELSSSLLMMNSIQSERQVPTRRLAESLVRVINQYPEDLELQLVACRCIYNLAEVNFSFIYEITSAGVIECLNSKLLDLSYIDMAEQALQALEIVSRKAGKQCLLKGSIPITLAYLDFFTIHAQRKALQIAANASFFITKEQYSDIETVFSTIKNVAINYSDPQCVESAWKFISNTIKIYNHSPSLLQNLIDSNFLKSLCEAFPKCLGDGKKSKGLVTFKTCISLLDALSLLAARSSVFSLNLVSECNIPQLMNDVFSSYQSADAEKTINIETLIKVPKDLMIALLKLVVSIIPINLSLFEELIYQDSGNYISLNKDDVSINNEKLERSIQNSDAYNNFYHDILDDLLNIYDSTVEYKIRRLILITFIKVISMMNLHQLESFFGESKIFSILGSNFSHGKTVLNAKVFNMESMRTSSILFGSLLVAHGLIIRNPSVFLTIFVKEGLMSQVKDLLATLETLEVEKDNKANGLAKARGIDNNIIPEYQEEDEYHEHHDFDEDMDDDELSDFEEQLNLRTADVNAIMRDGIVSMNSKLMINSLRTVCDQTLQNADSLLKKHNVKLSDAMSALEQFVQLLSDSHKSLSYNDSVEFWKRFAEILDPEKRGVSVSSFELVSSGITKQLLNAFEREENLNTPFCKAFQDIFCSTMSPYIKENTSPLLLFVNKLEESLDRSESFDIACFEADTTQNSRYRAASMTKQMKIKLTPLENLDAGSNDSVLLIVHAIATFETIQNFIKNSKSINLKNNFNLNSTTVDNEYHFEFFLNSTRVPPDSTVFGAVCRAHAENDSQTNFLRDDILRTVHQIKYKTIPGKLPIEDKIIEESLENLTSFTEENIIDIMKLLKVLFKLNSNLRNPVSSDALFLNYKLSAKLQRQLDEPLLVASGILPDWAVIIPREFSFLFPLETRLFFLKSTSFGYSRLIDYWLARSKDEGTSNTNSELGGRVPLLGRSVRHKLRISRERLFSSAVKVMETYAANPGLLEIEFFDEAGSGLGPTLEFYSNVSKEFGKLRLYMWRSDQYDKLTLNKLDSEIFVSDRHGLFPRPLSKENPHMSNTLLYFKVLGKFLARAFLDSRLVDFNFNPLFFEIAMNYALGREMKYGIIESISKIKELDESLALSLKHLNQYLKDFETIPEGTWDDHTIDGATVSDLMLSFVLPGYEEIELIPEGSDVLVTSSTLMEYIEKLIYFTLDGGILEQIKSFVEGFSEIFPFTSLKLFSSDELARLSGTEIENWSADTLSSVIHADHGYTKNSQQIQWLIEIMSTFDKDERRSFLKFITGSPRLPYDGFKGLSPPFTVVLKHSEDKLKPDDYLPSVMTCANYLKLPQYSSYEIMRKKILHAMNEGNDSFLLS
ncbi:hypothetical protein CANINC_000337 [Pichia inconspicua]|uniref:HECT-type E3 ubiquitin transferase n=1 Tax=Pichia inconspicua TaxID=52247 RepID=A0A4T0X6W1_9ASCO|nr:hypothetical protein CANINC_000337 [[Candida] inconspicua]